VSDVPARVVLDTVVFVQALISGRGPASACIDRLRSGEFILLLSDATLVELNDVPRRPKLAAKYPYLSDEKVEAFVSEIESLAVRIARPPNAFSLPRDPRDEPFIDLAIAGGARFSVTWNERHLTYLMKRDTREGVDFCNRFPQIQILPPSQFLAVLDAGAS
jgi:putative PIN family toxin of toxin-antitoxin system